MARARGRPAPLADARPRRQVGVLDHHRIVQPAAVIGAAPRRHRVLVEETQPGAVLRVSRTTAPVPAISSTHRRVAVAMPHSA
jgi:hypothetical protein